MYEETSKPLVRRTRHTLRSAELGFFGVVVYTRVHTPRRCGQFCSAGTSVPVKSTAALAMQALHRVRQGYVRRRTAMSNQMRGLLLEHGLAMAQGDSAFSQGIPRILEPPSTRRNLT